MPDSDPSEAAYATKTPEQKALQDVVADRQVKLIALDKRIAELQQEMQHLRGRQMRP
jgi:hypothetical protein